MKLRIENRKIEHAIRGFKTLANERLRSILKMDIAENIKILEAKQARLDAEKDMSDINGFVEFAKHEATEYYKLAIDGVIPEEKIDQWKHAKYVVHSEYPAVIEQIEKRKKEYEKTLSEMVEIEVRELSAELFPDELSVDLSPIIDFIAR